jgi:LacI family transcriptional regulator
MSDAELEEIAPSLRPLVLINRTTAAADVPSLVVDYGQGVQAIAGHLVELGHTRLAFLAGPPRSASNNLRLQGLEAFKAAHPQVEVTMLEGGSDFDTGHGAVDAVLESGATGILAFNDLVAMGLMSGLHERGLDVPGDISVTGFDDIPFAQYTTPALTTAAVPITELGAQAWHQLRALIRNEESQAPGSRYQPRLEVRASTGPAKAARTAVHG